MTKRQLGKVRIIGGNWRSRIILFPLIAGLRPTQDIIRETLFNWLASYIEGALCLDLFAGSGALGFESLSRGAAKVVFIDRQRMVLKFLEENIAALKAKNSEVIYGECPQQMPSFPKASFDIVFIDPPYHQGLIPTSIDWLVQSGCLKPQACIYLEAERALELKLPQNWEILKSKFTRTLQYHLILQH